MFAVGADGFVWRFFSIVFYFSFLHLSLSLSLSLSLYMLAMRCYLSEFRQKVGMYDTVLMLFPRRFNGMKEGHTPPVTESFYGKYVRLNINTCTL